MTSLGAARCCPDCAHWHTSLLGWDLLAHTPSPAELSPGQAHAMLCRNQVRVSSPLGFCLLLLHQDGSAPLVFCRKGSRVEPRRAPLPPLPAALLCTLPPSKHDSRLTTESLKGFCSQLCPRLPTQGLRTRIAGCEPLLVVALSHHLLTPAASGVQLPNGFL